MTKTKIDFLERLYNCNVPKLHSEDLFELYPEGFSNLEKYIDSSLFLYGKTGTGKSLLSIAVMYHTITHFKKRRLTKHHCFFIPTTDLLQHFRNTYNSNSEYSEKELFEICEKPYFLILDDLGIEKDSEWVMQMLDMIIDRRYRNKQKLIVTSNYDLESLIDRGHSRIVSRINSMCQIIRMDKQKRNH